MKITNYPEREDWKALLVRPTQNNTDIKPSVLAILDAVYKNGDKALRELTEKFDGFAPSDFQVSPEVLAEAESQLDEPLKTAIKTAQRNIQTFHEIQRETPKKVETMPGVNCWRKSLPIGRVGLYVPGGTAPLFSSLLMLGIPAKIAGCKEIVVCTPPDKNGQVHPAIRYVAQLLGITKAYTVGGAQAIAAMAYGTESIPQVDKIFGPGNSYVTLAKQLVQEAGVAIDMPAGPSEVLVIADAQSNPDFVAADLLSQAEHGPDSQVVLLVSDAAGEASTFVKNTQEAIDRQLAALPRKEVAAKALSESRIIRFKTDEEAISFSNAYAPEHLILANTSAEALSEKVSQAGSVFIGAYSCESAGDYASGTNHTLPTNGYARNYSGVSLDSFLKKITFQKLTGEGLQNIGPTVEIMAEAEQLQAHKNAVTIRLNALKNV
jgi:histidinol dehydrogenase